MGSNILQGRLGHGPFARLDRAPPIPMRDLICLRKWTSALPPSVLKLYAPDIKNASAAPLHLISPRYISTLRQVMFRNGPSSRRPLRSFASVVPCITQFRPIPANGHQATGPTGQFRAKYGSPRLFREYGKWCNLHSASCQWDVPKSCKLRQRLCLRRASIAQFIRYRFCGPWTDAFVCIATPFAGQPRNSQIWSNGNRRRRTRSMEQAHGPSLASQRGDLR